MNPPAADSIVSVLDCVGPDAAAPEQARPVSDAELAAFASIGTRREVAAARMLFRRGEAGRCMFIIESGQVNLGFDGDIPDKVIGEREFFGELALFVDDHARMASADTVTPCVLLVIERSQFDQLQEREPELMAQFMRRSFAYLIASEQQLVTGLRRRNEDLLRTMSSLHQTRSQLSLAQGQVRTDELTGLCNRRGLYVYLEGLPVDAAGQHLGLLLIDLDRFKQVNDHCGHLTGDEVLCAVARMVQAMSGNGDMLCRLGGDEFALLTHVRRPQELGERAERIVREIRQLRFPAQREDLRITVSIGGGLCHRQAGWSAWYSEIDRALYHVKGSGGDGWHILHSITPTTG
jgi:diguanylate cyclase (GGDEF)-like protein